MAHELLEYEVRRLPGVVAAAVDDVSVTLLVEPASNNDDLEVVVAAMLAAAGLEQVVRILGGTSSSAFRRDRRAAPVLAGGAAALGLLAMTATAAAIHGVLPSIGNGIEPTRTVPDVSPATAAPSPALPRQPGSRVIVPGSFPVWAAEQDVPVLKAPAAEPASFQYAMPTARRRAVGVKKVVPPKVQMPSPPPLSATSLRGPVTATPPTTTPLPEAALDAGLVAPPPPPPPPSPPASPLSPPTDPGTDGDTPKDRPGTSRPGNGATPAIPAVPGHPTVPAIPAEPPAAAQGWHRRGGSGHGGGARGR